MLWRAVVVVLVVLALTGDDRHAGSIADGRQMIRTAVAISETGETGQARGRDFTIDRDGGDAVSRFGMAMSLLQVPAATLAPAMEARYGPGSSQALFLIVPWLCVGLAAAAAGAIARRLDGNDHQVIAAVFLASIASPLGAYGLLEFSEPVQAVALAGAMLAALAASERSGHATGMARIAGACAGCAVLAKSNLVLALPAVLLPLWDARQPRETRRALLRAASGAAVPLAVWTAFELVRFGRLFGGYPDDRFTNPWFDGLWRLLVGPNRGLLLFWPALVLFVWRAKRGQAPIRTLPDSEAPKRGLSPFLATAGSRAWLGAALVLVGQVAVAAGYWGWHGMEGWGPRLIVAPLPLLAPFAATALGSARPLVLYGVVGACLVLNLPPLLQHPTPVATYIMNVAWPEVPPSEQGRYPFYATSRSPDGRTLVVPFAVLEREPSANPWRLYLWFWRTSHLDDARLAARLNEPPWKQSRPSIVPPMAWPPGVAREVAALPRLGFLGRSLTGTGGPYGTVYLDSLLDQVVRANQQDRLERALALSARRLQLRSDGEAAAWRLETLRRANRGTEAEVLLRTLPVSTREHPLINVALALFDRDGGEERRARALLASVAESFPGTPIQSALVAPLGAWPSTLDAITRSPRRDAAVAAPRQAK